MRSGGGRQCKHHQELKLSHACGVVDGWTAAGLPTRSRYVNGRTEYEGRAGLCKKIYPRSNQSQVMFMGATRR